MTENYRHDPVPSQAPIPAAVTRRRDPRHEALEIAAHLGRGFVGLRGVTPDPRLFAYLPLELAAREQVVPLEVDGPLLRLASVKADPDLALVRVNFPQLELELLSAAEPEISAALGRALRS
jgi:Type II secretion system (T2SS), protein E, N-terminal domain